MAVPPLADISFGGLESREIPERVPFEAAITCADCILDRDQIEGRSAYRDIIGSAIGGSAPQHLDRFRPDSSSARTVVVRGGQVHVVTDPSTVTASDGVASSLGTPFGTGDLISGAQLNDTYYLATDQSTGMQRITWTTPSTYTLSAIPNFPQPTGLSAASVQQPAWYIYRDLDGVAGSNNGVTSVSGCIKSTTLITGTNSTHIYGITGAGGDGTDPTEGATLIWTYNSDQNWAAYDWMAVSLSGFYGSAQIRNVTIEVGDSSGTNYAMVGKIYDGADPTPGAPNLIFCDLRNLDSTIKGAVRKIRFTVYSGTDGSTRQWEVYGHMLLASPPLTSPGQYYLDFYDSGGTGAQSPLSAVLTVQTVQPTVLGYPAIYSSGSDAFTNTGGTDITLSAVNSRNFNLEAGKAWPDLAHIGVIYGVTFTTPVITGSTGTLQARLWKQTPTGIRLVKTLTITSNDGSHTMYDDQGPSVSTNQLYKAGGTPPKLTALAQFAGRLIGGYQNTVYVSSYTPISDTSNPVPQFPNVPTETADGWQFNFMSKAEQILSVTAGDVVYIFTNYGLRVLTDVDAPLFGTPNIFKVGEFGITSRTGSIFCEDGLIAWCSYKGVYIGKARTKPVELSKGIRQYFIDTFQPDGTVTMAYQDRCLYIFRGTLGLRYNFITQRWSTLTASHSMTRCVSWKETVVSAVYGEQMWSLTSANRLARWQTTVSRDLQVGTDTTTGTTIPDWSYSTGFLIAPQVSRGLRYFSDVSGQEVRAYIGREMTGDPEREVLLEPGENTYEVPSDLAAYKLRIRLEGSNSTALRRLQWGVEELDLVSQP